MMEPASVLLTMFGPRATGLVSVKLCTSLMQLKHAQSVPLVRLTVMLIGPMMEPANVPITIVGLQANGIVSANQTFTLQILEHVIAVKQAQLT
jgi:hypothetical protein